ncbi:MAG: dihydrodipicolinate synthase family protein [Bacillota bacterium]
MSKSIPNGVWPTMITPFTDSGAIDYHGLAELIEWYLKNEVDGLFAVCLSSEMFSLSLAERQELAGFVRREVAGRVPVIASGNVPDGMDEQFREIEAMANAGMDTVVLITNRFAAPDEDDDIWLARMERVLSHFPELSFGLYECPVPYKRLLSPQVFRWCVSTGRFLFIKDTSCDLEIMRERLAMAAGSHTKIFNANAPTLLASLRLGVAGYSGVMANFHPRLYVWLTRHWRDDPEKAEDLQAFLGVASLIETPLYPLNAKYALQLEGVHIGLHCREKSITDFKPANRLEVEQLHTLSQSYLIQYRL